MNKNNNTNLSHGNHARICPSKNIVPTNIVFPPTNFESAVNGEVAPMVSMLDVVKGKKFVEENKK